MESYPSAFEFKLKVKGKIWKEMWIIQYDGFRIDLSGREYPERKNLGQEYTHTPNLAWFHAWQEIQKEMIKMFEV